MARHILAKVLLIEALEEDLENYQERTLHKINPEAEQAAAEWIARKEPNCRYSSAKGWNGRTHCTPDACPIIKGLITYATLHGGTTYFVIKVDIPSTLEEVIEDLVENIDQVNHDLFKFFKVFYPGTLKKGTVVSIVL